MATEIVEKKKHDQEQIVEGKSKGLNTLLWILSVAFFTAAAIGNVYFKDAFSLPVRVVGVVVALLIAFGLAAITNQGTKARTFFSEAKVEGRMANSCRNTSNNFNRNWGNRAYLFILLGN